jgi:phosphoenolpyruvate carboxylase
MLGYSDSAKDAGFLAANLALYRAQGDLAAWAAERRDRPGACSTAAAAPWAAAAARPGGRSAARPPGRWPGASRSPEQGEVIYARYGNLAIGHRHLEQVTNAVLGASTPGPRRPWPPPRPATCHRQGHGAAAEAAWRGLVEREGFAEFFATVTPIKELGLLRIGSRPARREGAGGAAGGELADLRAIPWVFAWSQNRCNLPGWFGLGTGWRWSPNRRAASTCCARCTPSGRSSAR